MLNSRRPMKRKAETRRTYYIVHTNCDCCANLIALTHKKWIIGPKCQGCGKILGWMEYDVYESIQACGPLEAVRKWRVEKQEAYIKKLNDKLDLKMVRKDYRR